MTKRLPRNAPCDKPKAVIVLRRVLVTACLTALIVLVPACGVFTGGQKPLVFAVNLSSHPVDIQITEDDHTVAQFQALGTNEVHPMIPINVTREVSLRVLSPGQPPVLWTDQSGLSYTLRLSNRDTYAAVVDPEGHPALMTVHRDNSPLPKLSFINVTTGSLAQVEVAPDFNKNIKAYLQNVPPNQPAEFTPLPSRPLAVFWQTTGQNFTGDYFSIQNAQGRPLLTPFENNHFYLALLGNNLNSQEKHGLIQDITPASY